MELIFVGILVFTISVLVLNRILGGRSGTSKRTLESISRETYEDVNSDQSVLIKDEKEDLIGESLIKVPFFGGLYKKLKLSGLKVPFIAYLGIFIAGTTALGMALGTLLNHMYGVGFFLGFMVVLIISNMLLGRRIDKREEYYLQNFPDAVDMIVRSVKSGQPLLSALKMISVSASEPLASDVKRVIDEVAYGRPLPEALRKMADRVGFLDMNFFVVILSVQQETGGNLSEVLGNLAGIIRKRKQLKLKIKALTAQSKMTTMIFSGIPFLQMGAIYAIKPDYLKPFTNTTTGVYALLFGLACVSMAIFLGRKVSKIEV